MRVRGLLIAVILLAGLGGAIWWSNKKEAEKAAAPPADAGPVILKAPEGQIVKVEIRKQGEGVVVEKKDNKWQITSPKPYPADQDMMMQYLPMLASVSADRLIDEKASNIAQYGLTKPSLELLVTTADGKTQHLLIGDPTPSGGGAYAASQGSARVYTIASVAKTGLDRSVAELRDKRLLTYDEGMVKRMELDLRGQTIELAQDERGEWQIVKPRAMRADGAKVDEILRHLTDAKLDTSASDDDLKKNAAAFSAAAPFAAARVSDKSVTQELQLRRGKDKTMYVKSGVVEGVYTAPDVLIAALDKGLEDLRNRRVFDFGWNDPLRISVRDGANQTTYDHSTGTWASAGKSIDPKSIQTAIEKLRGLSAASLPEKGFTAAAWEVEVAWNGGKYSERVSFCQAGSDWIAQRQGDSTLYQLDGKSVSELRQALAGIKPAPPAKKK